MKLVIFLSLAIAATAIPSDYAPEETLIGAEAHAEAQARVNALLAAGKTDSACRDLAQADIKAVENDVKTQQNILKNLPDGKSCNAEGQKEVTKAKNTKKKADKTLKRAKEAESKALHAPLKYKTTLGAVEEGKNCVVEHTDTHFKAAKKDHDKAVKDRQGAAGKAKQAQTSLDNAIKAAANEKHACLCRTQAAHAKAWAAATKKQKHNDIAYQKGKNMLCVLNGKSLGQCKKHSAPKLKEPKITADAKNAKCPSKQASRQNKKGRL